MYFKYCNVYFIIVLLWIVNFVNAMINGDFDYDSKMAKFFLYTNSNPDIGTVIDIGNISALQTANYDNSLPTKFIIHGWRDNVEGYSNIFIRPAFLQRLKCNVFVVDWEAASYQIYSLAAMINVYKVGEEVARFMEFLMKETGLELENIHLIGHSLGAHVAAWASKKMEYGKVPRITGLEVALPLYNLIPRSNRLSKDSADFVEAFHTNGGYSGFKRPIGHVDFYANDGTWQPGCSSIIIIPAAVCSHLRVNVLYGEMISGVSVFVAKPCRSQAEAEIGKCTANAPIVYLTGVVPRSDMTHNIYRFDTADTSPFSNIPQNDI